MRWPSRRWSAASFGSGALGSALAIYLGKKAQAEIGETHQPGEGMARTGILLGWLGVAITVIWFLAFASIFSSVSSKPARLSAEERVAAEMNVRSALKDAGRAETRHHEQHGTYTDDYGVITAKGLWTGVTLGIIRADETGFCIEARYGDMPRVWHITETKERAAKGAC